jgi:glutathione S-transferase
MPTIVLYQFPGAYGLRSLSPFCTKLEAYFVLADVPYESKLGNPQQAPKGKLPYVRWDGALFGDSQLVLERCRAELGDPLDAPLSPTERARGHLVRRTAEDHLYWVLLAVRWGDEGVWRGTYRDTVASMMPALARPFVPALLRRRVCSSLKAHGLGRHRPEEIAAAGEADLAALEEAVGDGPFLFGDAPSSFDCALWAMLEHLRRTEGEHPLIDAMRGRSRLGAYCDRMAERVGEQPFG